MGCEIGKAERQLNPDEIEVQVAVGRNLCFVCPPFHKNPYLYQFVYGGVSGFTIITSSI